MIYVRTDKNGTKIYHDYTCLRCGGQGGLDQWTYTGYTCFECGGTGKRVTPRIIKEYTPEYRAKLDERARKREEKKRLERVNEFNTNLANLIKEKGFNDDGKLLLVIGDTYPIKDELKANGATWNSNIKGWTFLHSSDYPTIELTAEECLNFYPENGFISWKDYKDIRSIIDGKLPKEETNISEYIGNIGERIEIKVVLENWYSFEIPSYTGWGMMTKVLYKFRDMNNNILVWNTTGYGVDSKIQKGDELTIRGTISKHSEYKGDKQTELKRCRIK